MRKVILGLIKIYQKTLSLDHGFVGRRLPFGGCRFRPTCSQYGYQAIEKKGIFLGGWQTLKRISRCHPFSRGGYDPFLG